jgi:hypothetical protein
MDIVFSTYSDNSGPLLNVDTETVSNVGVSTMNYWVKIPTLTTATLTAATFYAFYGNSGVTTYQGVSTNTWDSNYKGVWHLPNGSSLSGTDSTSNANNLSNNGSPAAGTGQIDGAASYNGSSENYSLTVPTTALDNWTISAWAQTSAPSTLQGVMQNGWDDGVTTGGGYGILSYLGDWQGIMDGVVILDSTKAVPTNTWNYVVFTRNAGTAQMYVNGVASGGTSASTPNVPARGVSLGAQLNATTPTFIRPLTGLVDEARVSSTPRSSDWIKTEYNNQSSPSTFVTIGAETACAAAAPPYTPLNRGLSIQGGKTKIMGSRVKVM